MKQSWDQRIARAQELSQQHPSASELLDFFGRYFLRLHKLREELLGDLLLKGSHPISLQFSAVYSV